jgi:hypothetical protein
VGLIWLSLMTARNDGPKTSKNKHGVLVMRVLCEGIPQRVVLKGSVGGWVGGGGGGLNECNQST